MPIVSTLLKWSVLAGAVLAYVYYMLATYSAWRFFRQRRRLDNRFQPPVSVLKPVRGLDREAYENFASFCRQDYPEYEILFGVADEHDSSVPTIRKLIQDFPERSIHLLIGSENLGANSKVNKLCRLAREARYDHLVISDSDIRVGPGYLRSVVAPLRSGEVGIVTCPFRGLAGQGLISELEAVGISSDLLAGAITDWQLEEVRFAYGSTIALTRERLSEIGGFEALVDQLADDYQLARRMAARGYRVEFSPYSVLTVCGTETWRDFFLQELRWSVTMRQCRPWGHFGLLLTHGLAWSLGAALVTGSRAVSLGMLGVYSVLRLVMAWTVGVWGLKDPLLRRRLWLVPLWDALGFSIWLVSLFSNRIRWRGQEFYVHKGRLIPVPAGAGRS